MDKEYHSGGSATCDKRAVCSVCGFEYGDKLGHSWGEIKYTWNSDGTCKAERICNHDNTHIQSEIVTVSKMVIKEATCIEKGKVRYTAQFTNSAFGVQYREVDIELVEHKLGEWIDEIPATTEEFGTKGHYKCSVCGKYYDKDGQEIAELRIAKIGTHNIIINGESKFYADGENVTITAEDKEGKVFKGWKDASGNLVSTDKNFSFKVSGESNYTAIYENEPTVAPKPQEPKPQPQKPDIDSAQTGEDSLISGGMLAGLVCAGLVVIGAAAFVSVWFATKKKY